MEFGSLVDVLHHLPAGSSVNTTSDGEQRFGRRLTGLSVEQACDLVVAFEYHQCDAEYSADTHTIFVYSGVRWMAFPMFTVVSQAPC